MTFFLSKFLWTILNPFNFIFIILFLSFLFNFFSKKKISNFLFLLSFILFLLIGFFPTGKYLFFILERNFHEQKILPDNLDGIIILGGATNPLLTKVHKQISLNGSVERLTESIKFIKKYPNVKVFFAGGSGSLSHPELSHSAVAKLFYTSLNINLKNIYFDQKSRNTHENILFAKNFFNPNMNQKWIIVSSAFHLPRAMNIAQKLNWNLIPYATDFRLSKEFSWKPSFNFFNNFYFFQQASHEWIGIVAYYLLGRSDRIFYR